MIFILDTIYSTKGVENKEKWLYTPSHDKIPPFRISEWAVHVTSHGDRREAIFEDEDDRVRFLEILGTGVADFNWLCHGYCLMDNHYHLIIAASDIKLKPGHVK